ncbi:DUF2160 domain-containing protein [Paracoccus sp. MBLB3053]|uniref:DUF2160 domain-containing protein n=1 Tax=Paracoccus aurantius TaxID=3073814 RepID=A0ABU2HNQ2_9RHOB|nr:DUF2160 domain-containing protein [Paracoccus sp. MBLB3053]MDS9466657.1 DUF2160 domain-containing protein [Paracoccus sp. MBLB3053]
MSDAAIDKDSRTPWPAVYMTAAIVLGAVLAFLLWAVPVRDGARQWTAPMIAGGWMAWTFPVALFFWTIASLLVIFTILAVRFPETPRAGVLRIETTRGDRLFITLLGSAFICLGWLFLAGPPVWWGLGLSLAYAAAVFRWV